MQILIFIKASVKYNQSTLDCNTIGPLDDLYLYVKVIIKSKNLLQQKVNSFMINPCQRFTAIEGNRLTEREKQLIFWWESRLCLN